MEDAAIKNLNEIIRKQKDRIKALEKIAELALDLHTSDPLIINDRWGVSGVKAEKLLCEMIEKGV